MRMSDLLKRLKSIFILELPANYQYLSASFRQAHQLQCNFYPNWPIEATSRQLISDYWTNILRHYLLMLGIGMLITLLFLDQQSIFNGMLFSVLALTGFLVYLPLYFIVYRPIFFQEFLPRLAAARAEFEGKERLHAEKCKQAQMSNTALAIIFYVFTKTSEIPLNKVDMQLGNQLMTLFGSNPDSLQKALKLITCKGPAIGPHKQTELEKSFEEARCFFGKLKFSRGLEIVDHLERRCRRLQQ